MDKQQDGRALIQKFKQDLISTINNAELPGYIIYEIVNGVTLQIQNQMLQEKIDTLNKINNS